MSKTIIIAGKDYELLPLESMKTRQVWTEAKIAFLFYSCTYKDVELVVLETKEGFHFTPRKLRLMAEHLITIFQMPVVFLFDSLPYLERDRLINQNVYFIVSGKYVFLPNLIIAIRDVEPLKANQLSPAAQWLLFGYLQGHIQNNITARELESITPYKYVTITLAFRLLESLKLCQIETGEDSYKRMVFNGDKLSLYNLAKPYLINPVRERMYCDEVVNANQYKQAGISALSHYSALNPEEMRTIAIPATQWRERQKDDFIGINPYEGKYCIEVWQYLPIPADSQYVDKLSLAWSLQNDHDPRVEKEVEQMVEQIW